MTGFINNLLSVNKNEIPEREMNEQEGKNKGDGRTSDRIVGFINSIVKKKTDGGTRVDIEKISRGGVSGIKERHLQNRKSLIQH
jgi:hypothetical protein